jgi:hypothetical protein
MFEDLFNQRQTSKRQANEAGTDRSLRAKILEGTTDVKKELTVFVETLGENARRGPCKWFPVVDTEGNIFTPAGGEECLLEFDDHSLPWISQWSPTEDSHKFDSLGKEGPPGKDGKEGKQGENAPPTYADLIALDSPIAGWDLQDAASVSALAAAYGANTLSILKGVTSGDVSNPLYPGAKAIHLSGGENDCASTAAPSALTTYKHMTAEIWVYLPADTGMSGMALFVGKNTVTYEGWGSWFGSSNAGAHSSEYNSSGVVKSGIRWELGDGAISLSSADTSTAVLCSQIGKGWHHLCWRTMQNGFDYLQMFVDGNLAGTIFDGVDTNYGDHTENERAIIGNYLTEASTVAPNNSEILFAHAYVYDHRLTHAAIRARSDLVATLNAI